MKNDIIDVYEIKSRKIIDDLSTVKEFKETMKEKQDKIKDFKVNNSVMYKLTHPVKVIKNTKESLRLKNIQSTFDYYYNSSVLKYITEENGDLTEDLDNAIYFEKPNYIVGYIKSLNLKK